MAFNSLYLVHPERLGHKYIVFIRITQHIYIFEAAEAAEREVMFPEAPLGIGKNYLIHRFILFYLPNSI